MGTTSLTPWWINPLGINPPQAEKRGSKGVRVGVNLYKEMAGGIRYRSYRVGTASRAVCGQRGGFFLSRRGRLTAHSPSARGGKNRATAAVPAEISAARSDFMISKKGNTDTAYQYTAGWVGKWGEAGFVAFQLKYTPLLQNSLRLRQKLTNKCLVHK